jgi:glutamate dehydrogenase
VAALSRSVPGSAQELDAYEALLNTLEDAGRFDRVVEGLPTSEELHIRRAAGAGLIRPELAVLLAYAKSDLVAAIEASPTVTDEALLDSVVPYFPVPIRDAFADLIPGHRLYPQLVATDVAGEIVDQLGIVWAHETAAELGRDLSEVALAFWAARRVIGAGERWDEIETRAADLSADAEVALHGTISRAVGRLARSYLTTSGPFRLVEVTARDEAAATEVVGALAPEATKSDEDALVEVGVKRALAGRFVSAAARAQIGEAGPAAARSGRRLVEAAAVLAALDRIAGLDRLTEAVGRALAATPPPSRLAVWQGRALLDDIAGWRSAAAAAVLADPDPPAEAVSRWEAQHTAELGRARALLATLGPDTPDPLAVVALVLRRLHLAL